MTLEWGTNLKKKNRNREKKTGKFELIALVYGDSS
jgi:hypothetical protein